MNIPEEQVNASIDFFKKQLVSDSAHSAEYKSAICALNAVRKINDAIAELEKRDKDNWDRSSSDYCWGASKAYEASANIVRAILKDD